MAANQRILNAFLLLAVLAGLGQAGQQMMLSDWGKVRATDVVERKIDEKLYFKRLESAVTLTDEQKQSLTAILAERTKDLEECLAARKEKMEAGVKAMMEARESGDQDIIKKSRDDYQAIMAPFVQLIRKYNDRLSKVFTPEQIVTLEDYQLTEMIKVYASPTKLTDAQIKKVKAGVKIVAGGDAAEQINGIRNAINDVRTPEQKAELTVSRAWPHLLTRLASAKLTPEQKQQFQKIAAEVAKDSTLEITEVVERVMEKAGTVLTAEQRARLTQAPKNQGEAEK